jgi:hypothetical protein
LRNNILHHPSKNVAPILAQSPFFKPFKGDQKIIHNNLRLIISMIFVDLFIYNLKNKIQIKIRKNIISFLFIFTKKNKIKKCLSKMMEIIMQ